jgi:hypothetical protein
MQDHANAFKSRGMFDLAEISARRSAEYRRRAEVITSLLPEPESGADAPASPPFLEPSTEANP